MIWIAWRYQRSVVLAFGLLAVVVIGFAIVNGVMQHHAFEEFFAAPCHGSESATNVPGDRCGILDVNLANAEHYSSEIRFAGYIIAPLVGGILGLLAVGNELDNRTARLAWTQSISRNRWFAAKASVGAAIVTALLVPVAVVLSWWSGQGPPSNVFNTENFGVAGWDLVAYGLFMFALTLLTGTVIRRVGWALAASILIFLAIAATVPSHVRPHLVTPTVHWSAPTLATKGNAYAYADYFPQNSLLLVNGVVSRNTVGIPTWSDVIAVEPRISACEGNYPQESETKYVKREVQCYRKFDVEQVSVYIPGDQFWTLQFREGVLYLVAGLVLAGGSLLIVRRIEP
jgi:hypothetical protein